MRGGLFDKSPQIKIQDIVYYMCLNCFDVKDLNNILNRIN